MLPKKIAKTHYKRRKAGEKGCKGRQEKAQVQATKGAKAG
jgi:hypothetical protein